jgi:hypothetical protein
MLREALFRPIAKLGRPRALVRGHFLCVLERTAVGEIGSDSVDRVTLISSALPAAVPRLRIVRQSSGWPMGFSDSIVPLCSD